MKKHWESSGLAAGHSRTSINLESCSFSTLVGIYPHLNFWKDLLVTYLLSTKY